MLTALVAWAGRCLSGVGGALLELIVALFLLVVLLGAPYWVGRQHQKALDAATVAKTALKQHVTLDAAVDKAREKQLQRDDVALSILRAEQKAILSRNFSLDHEVTRYVQTHPAVAACGLDAGGLRLWRTANAAGAAVSRAPRNADPAMPAAADAGKRKTLRPAGQSRGHHGLVPPVPGPS